MSTSADRDEIIYDPGSVPPKASSFPGTAPKYRLYNPPSTKVCYFYKDGDQTHNGHRVTVNRKHFPNMEILKKDLTHKVPGLPFGVRSIYTSRGRHAVSDLDLLEHGGNYVCSTHQNRAKGVDVNTVHRVRPWHGGRAPSGRRAHNRQLRDSNTEVIGSPRRAAWGPPQRDTDDGPFFIRPKKITVVDMDNPKQQHVLLLNRRMKQSFEEILGDISQMFQIEAKKLYTIEGRPIRSLSAIFNGPNLYLVTEGDSFKPTTSKSEPPAFKRQRKPLQPRNLVANRLRDKRERLSKTRGKWKVWLTTNELPSAGTEAEVTVTVYGHKGNSGPLPIGYADGQSFQPGNVDEFEISVGNIGEIYKIRVAHDNQADFPGWFLDEVRMRDQHTDEELTFKCQRWLSRDEDDGEICRELPAVRDREDILPVIPYEVSVYTGDLWNAGTTANVYITLYGERGDTGVRQLYRGHRTDKFRMGQMDIFTVEAVSLGNLKRAIIGHDGTGPGNGWFIEKIIIRESPHAKFEWIFPCDRWLDEGEDDGKLVRELKPLGTYDQDLRERQMFEMEKWKYEPDCVVMLYSKVTQRPISIRSDTSVDAAAEYKDITGQFRILVRKGMLRGFQNVANSKFHLALDNGKITGKGKGGSYCEFLVRIQSDRSAIFESTKYKNQVLTFGQNGRVADPRGPHTDPTKQFFVYCKGMFRESGVIMLCTSISQTLRVDDDHSVYATGRRDKLAHFRVHKVHDSSARMFESVVFSGQFIRFKDGQIDCKGRGDKYCQFKVERVREQGYVTLESVSSRGLYIGMTTEGRVRPVVNTGDKNSRIYPEVIQFGKKKRRHVSPPPDASPLPLPSKPTKVQRRRRSPSPEDRSPTPTPRTPTPQKTPTPEPPKEKSFEEGDWKVWVTTDEANEGGDVAMVVYGDQGKSKPVIIGKASDNSLFQTGNQDEFKVNLLNLGKIYKVRMELLQANKRRDPTWKLKEVKMKDAVSGETLRFRYNRWLSKAHDDGDTMRELPAIRPKQPVPQVFMYQVHVYTGDEAGADTDANVFINIFGERGDTGKRLLHRSDKKSKFQEGQVDLFEVEAVDLGPLKRCIISHDGDGAGEGWYCEKVIIRETQDAESEYIFQCSRWLDTSIEDRKIERVLRAQERKREEEEEPRPIASATKKAEEEPEPEPEEEKPKDGDWRIWIHTGRDDGMGTANEVTLVAYGDQDVSEPVVLGTGRDGEYFKPGNTDDFKVNLGPDLGELYKIRVGHNDDVEESGWFLEKVKMKNLVTEEVLTFRVNRWMSRSEEDLDVWRELPAVKPGKQPLPVLKYTVEVYTGSEPGADTEAVLYLQMIGQRGDSGKRVLYQSKNNEVMFQEGQVDIFNIEAVDLDDVTKVVVGHDENGKGAGWYCDKVIVKVGEDDEARMFYFPCGKWLDKGQEDGKIERTLTPKAPPKQSKGEYHVEIQTNNRSRPNNNSGAVLVVYGEKGRSRDLDLFVDSQGLFEPGNIDELDLSVGDIGEPYKIRIGRQDADNWEGWYLDSVKLQDKDTEEEYLFSFNRWMDRARDDCDIVRELPVTKDGQPVLPVTHYEVSVYTGDHWAADTDASVYLTLHGSKGDAGKRWLYKSRDRDDLHDRFQRNQLDTFIFEAVTLQDPRRLVIGHTGSGHGAGWFLDKVVVKDLDGAEHAGKEFVFACGRWLDDEEDDKKTERELRVMDVQDEGTKPKPVKRGSKTQGEWKVAVKTSDVHNAGTHAQVYLTAYGDKGRSKPRPLGKAKADCEDFEKGKEAEFTINVGDIGTLYKIRLEHDSAGNFPDWHVEQLTMSDGHTGEELKFYINRWLAVEEEDGATCRELPVVRPGKPALPVLHYSVAVYTANIKEAATTANVSLTLYGENGDSGQRRLEDSLVRNAKFIQGQIDFFIIEAVQLGKLTKIDLTHDGEDKDSAWFVEKVIVKEGMHALNEHLFNINDWIEPLDPTDEYDEPRSFPLAAYQPFSPLPEDDQSLLRGSQPTSRGSWHVWTLTGDAQTDPVMAKVSISLCGTLGASEPVPLIVGRKATDHRFEADKMDMFKASVPDDIGQLIKVRLVMDVSEEEPEWFLKRLKLKDSSTKEEFHFHYADWVKKSGRSDRGDPETEVTVELAAVRPDLPPLEELTYQVTVVTGDEPRADTDAHLYCTLIGHWGDTGKRRLLKSKTNKKKLCRGQEDVFEIPAIDVGKLSKILIGHDTKGKGRGWHCDKVKVKTSEDAETEVLFPCNRWFDTGCEDRKIERELEPIAELSLAPTEDDNKPPSNGEFKVGLKMANNNQQSPKGNSSNNNSNYDENSNNNNSNFNENCNNNNGNQEDTDESDYDEFDDEFDYDFDGEFTVQIKMADDESNGQESYFENSNLDYDNDDLNYSNQHKNFSDDGDDFNYAGHSDLDYYDDLNCNNNSNKAGGGDGDSSLPTSGAISLVVYGEKGKSDAFELDPTLDDLNIYAGDVGEVYKVRVCSGQDPGPKTTWGVQEISLQDASTKEKLLFDFSKFVGEVGGDTSKELPAIRPNRDVLPVTTYQVSIITSKDSPNEPKQPPKTSKKGERPGKPKPQVPEMYITLLGSQGDSGARHLTTNKEASTKFQPGQTDVFTLDAVDLGDVEKIVIHKMPEVGWKLDKVLVKCGPYAPRENIFTYDKVFEERHKLEREEDVEISMTSTQRSNTAEPSEEQSNGNWKVTTRTGSDNKAAASNNVTVTMCGEKCESKAYPLPISKRKGAKSLQPGETDDFMIHVTEDIGEVTKVRFAFEEGIEDPSWLVEEVTFEDVDTQDEFTLEIHDWITATDELEAWREYPVTWPGAETLQTVKYQVEVYTGDNHKGGTKANVYILLHGQEGSSGKYCLKKSLTDDKTKFSKGQVDKFEFEGVELGPLLKATAGHDGQRAGDGWYLDKMIVIQGLGSPKQRRFEFECDRWLDSGEDDKAIERVLEVSDAPIQEKSGTKWKVTVKTHQHKDASPRAKVVMVLYGSGETSQEIPIGDNPETCLQAGSTENYDIIIDENVGDIYKVRVGYPESELDTKPFWLLDEMSLENQSSGKEYRFMYNDWVRVGDDYWVEIPVHDDDRDNILPVITYNVEVYTSNLKNAETDANVHIIMYGEHGDTGKRPLNKSNNARKYRQGQVDKFELRAVDLETLKKVTVGHDGKGRGAGWHLEKVVIINPKTGVEATFNCDRWMDEGEDDGHIERDLQATKGNPWKVTVSTVKQKNASPGAPVYIVLYGDQDKSLELPLEGDPDAILQPGRTEDFDVLVPQTLGELYKVRVGYPESEHSKKPFWYLNKVRIEDETSGEVYEFEHNDWVSVTEEEDGSVEIPRVMGDADDTLPVLTYTLEVHTADDTNAGTNANVYVTLTGERGDTGKRLLLKSDNANKFEQGQVDKFELKAVDLGEVQKVTAGHDGKGPGAGWLLNKVIITYPTKRDPSTFLCERWMDEGEDDAKLERELVPDKGSPWKATVTTGKPRNASPGCQVVMVIYGDNDKSEEHPLGDNPQNVLRPGETEDFDLLLKKAVGTVYKIRVGYPENAREDNPSWFLDKIHLEDCVSGDTYDFVYGDWVKVERDCWVELPVQEETILPVINYSVEVKTGDKHNASTDANVYMIMYGERGDTGKRPLMVSNNKDKFDEGQTDIFEVQAVDLGEVTKVTFGHDCHGAGDGWYLEKVIVANPNDDKQKWTFECDRWLDEEEDDNLIERDLKPSTGAFWTISATTGRHTKASPGAQVVIVLYGDGGKSQEIPLGDDPEGALQSGETEDFDVLVPELVGDLYKVRVGYPAEDRKALPSWLLSDLTLVNHGTEQTYRFTYNDRVRVTDDTDGWVEIPVQEHEDRMLPVVTYTVDVHTGDRFNAGTNANVYLMLTGERGDTGCRQLQKSTTFNDKFEEGQVDTFEIRAVDLDKITMVTVGHDGTEAGSGWYLNKIVVHDPDDKKKTSTFKCDKWLDEGEDDFKLERELRLEDAAPWTATVITGKNRNACPKASVVLQLYGDDGASGEIPIGNDPETSLQSGATENFEIKVPATIGDLYKVRVFYTDDDRPNKPFWYLSKIKLQNQSSNQMYEFVYNDWVKVTDELDGAAEIALEEHADNKLPLVTYLVHVHTGDKYNASTNANVYLMLSGERGDTGKRHLLKSQHNDKFEEGQVDTFEIKAIDLGSVTEVTVGHDGKGAGAGWYLDKVVVHDPDNHSKTDVFKCNKWLDEEEGDGAIQRVLRLSEDQLWVASVVTGRHKNACPRAPVLLALYGDGGQTADIPLGNDPDTSLISGETENFEITVPDSLGELYKVRVGYPADCHSDQPYWYLSSMTLREPSSKREYLFKYDEWIRVTPETDGWTEIPVEEHEDSKLPMEEYSVDVHTTDKYLAGTNANVYLMLSGERGDTGRRQMLKSQHDDKFEEGQVDTFTLRAVDLGEVKTVTVGHDGKGAGAGWHLSKVVVRSKSDKKSSVFRCDRWLDEDEKDGKLELELHRRTGNPYTVTVTTGKHKTAAPGAQVVMVMYGNDGQSQELPLGDDPESCLQSGEEEVYQVVVPDDLDELYKIRVGYAADGRKDNPSWFMDKIHILDKTTTNEYEFVYKDWVKVTDDTDGWVEIPLKDHEDSKLPVFKYVVDVYTGDKYLAGTNANVYLMLTGERGDTGKRQLCTSQHQDKFEEGQMDTFEIEAVDLDEIKRVTVGHDGKGAGAGWFLDKVIVHDPEKKAKPTIFECSRWIDEDEKDGKLELDLEVNKKHPWRVTVTTAQQKNASPGSEVVLALYGTNDKSEDIPLGNDPQTSLQPGKTETFQINVEELIGELYKIRVGYSEDDQKKKPFWNLEKVKLEDLSSGESYEFVYNNWVTVTTEEDGWVELPTDGHVDTMLPVLTYSVEVYTSEKENAGTKANTFIKLYGERGDTGIRKLLKSDNKEKFKDGQVDKFEVKAVDLDNLKKITLGHDGKGRGAGWLVDKVVVKDPTDSDNSWCFKCGKWMDEDEGDGAIVRDIEVGEEEKIWKVWVVSGDPSKKSQDKEKDKDKKSKSNSKKGSNSADDDDDAADEYKPPSGTVVLTVYGDKDKSDEMIPLVAAEGDEEKYQDGATDTFEIKIPQTLGEVYKVRVGFSEETTDDQSWYLYMLVLRDTIANKDYVFEVKDKLIQTDELEGWREVAVKPTPEEKDGEEQSSDNSQKDGEEKMPPEPLPVHNYEVEVYTGSEKKSGTNANVYLNIYGERGDTGKRKLLKSDNSNKFEEGKVDKFMVPAVDLGKKLTKVTVGHDGKGIGSGWFLDKIIIKNPEGEKALPWEFECNKWLDEGQDDGLIERDIEVKPVIDDGEWKVSVTTSAEDQSGTEAQVTITVFGDKGDSGPLPLGEPNNGLFETGATDEFDIVLDPEVIGKVLKIRIEHDNRSEGCGWHLEKVVMENKQTRDSLTFAVDRWLAEDEDDGDLVRELAAEWPEEEAKQVTKYTVQTVTGKDFAGGSECHAYITLFGKNGDSGKRWLNKTKEGKNKFEKGQTDTFTVEAIDLGDLEKVVVGQDDSGSGSGWYLDKVVVKETDDGDEINFPCDKWLDANEDDGKTERELFVDGKSPDNEDGDGKKD